MTKENAISKIILDAAFKVHSTLGPGLLESTYKACMAYELSKRGCKVEVEKAVPLNYEEVKLEVGFRMDLLVDDLVVVELKSVDAFNEVHLAQTLTYLRLGKKKLGLLLNFKVKSMKDGIKRVIL